MAGDWEQFAKASDTLNSLSFFCGDLAQDLKVNISALLTSWSGNAANEAFLYFNGLGDAVNGYAAGLRPCATSTVRQLRECGSFPKRSTT